MVSFSPSSASLALLQKDTLAFRAAAVNNNPSILPSHAFENEEARARFHEVSKKIKAKEWNDFHWEWIQTNSIDDNPLGLPLDICSIIQCIEQEFCRSRNLEGASPDERQKAIQKSLIKEGGINECFQMFTRIITPLFEAIQFHEAPFNISMMHVTALQTCFAAREDEALQIIWQTLRSRPELNHIPDLNKAEEIREWLKVPANLQVIQAITELILNDCKLKVLPREIGLFTGLVRLDLSNNQIVTLPASIGDLHQLNRLYLNLNQIVTLPASIGNLKQMQWLDLSYNQLVILPASIGDLPQLNGLYLNNNQLVTLPASIGNLQQLDGLTLNNNQIITLPASIGNLQQLQRLVLSNNQIVRLPDSIRNLQQLRSLYLDNNRIVTLPASIGNFQQLLWLNLRNNRIETMPVSIRNLGQRPGMYLFV